MKKKIKDLTTSDILILCFRICLGYCRKDCIFLTKEQHCKLSSKEYKDKTINFDSKKLLKYLFTLYPVPPKVLLSFSKEAQKEYDEILNYDDSNVSTSDEVIIDESDNV